MPDQLAATLLPEPARGWLSAPETDVRLTEANHRIANTLTLLSGVVRLRAAEISTRARTTLSSSEAVALLREIEGRIVTIARLHSQLAREDEDAPIEVGSYLQDVANDLVSCLCVGGQVLLRDTSTRPCLVPARQALPIALIGVEIITNALKYAHPTGVKGVIHIGCNGNADSFLVEVLDDGVGLPEGFDASKDGGLGLRIVRSLADQLDAKLAFDHDGLGLCFRMTVPMKQASPVASLGHPAVRASGPPKGGSP